MNIIHGFNHIKNQTIEFELKFSPASDVYKYISEFKNLAPHNQGLLPILKMTGLSTIRLSILSVLLSHVASNDLQIISAHGNLGPEPCAKTCVGTTAESTTPWQQDIAAAAEGVALIKTTVDISDCGFVSTPIVTTSLHTGRNTDPEPFIGALVSGQSNAADLTKDSFTVYLYGFHSEKFKPFLMIEPYGSYWDIHWSAFGFIC